MAILSVHIGNHHGWACPRCKAPVLNAFMPRPEADFDQLGMLAAALVRGYNTLMDAEPDPLGTYRIAWSRGDHGEDLAYHPPGDTGKPDPEALLGCRLDGLKLYSVHRCTG